MDTVRVGVGESWQAVGGGSFSEPVAREQRCDKYYEGETEREKTSQKARDLGS